MLKHKGDRNYYEFTLAKGQKKPVGTVSLELKKSDQKKSKFTLVIYADDPATRRRTAMSTSLCSSTAAKIRRSTRSWSTPLAGKNQFPVISPPRKPHRPRPRP